MQLPYNIAMHDFKPSTSTPRAPSGRFLTLLTLCLAVLIAQVDTTVVNLAVRPIGQYFGAGIKGLQWVVDSYNLAYCAFLLTGGLLADLYGRRRVFMMGAGVFTAASLLCALAPSTAVLIASRGLAGLGAALLLPASLSIIRVAWTEPSSRARALGIWAACNGLALAIAPGLGGLLIHRFGWRSIFLVVVPLGVAAIVLARISIPESADPQGRRFQAASQILGALGLGSLTFAATEVHQSPLYATLALAVAAAGFGLFLRSDRKSGAGATVPLDMFRLPEFRSAIIATGAMTFGMYGALFLVPLAWQETGRFQVAQAGWALMPMATVFVIVSPFSGTVAAKIGQRLATCSGVAIIGGGLLLLAWGATRPSIAPTEAGLALAGLGMGFATGPLMGAAVNAVSAERSGIAGALINVVRMIGATLGVAVLGSIFALENEGSEGLRSAMLFGGAVQVCAAALAGYVARPRLPFAPVPAAKRTTVKKAETKSANIPDVS